MMSQEPERNTNHHAHSARDQTKQGIQARFIKGREKRLFQQSTSNRVIWGPFIKKKDKRGLNTTDHVQ